MTAIAATLNATVGGAFKGAFGSSGWARNVWALSAAIVAGIALFDPAGLAERLAFAASALGGTAPFIVFATILIAWMRAAEAEAMLAGAFQGRETTMILAAALIGGLAPFCSCEVIPFVAALLAAGAPVSAVMAFWLSSPLMDPPSFIITMGALGLDFAIGKTVAAVGVGLMGGFAMKAMGGARLFADPLRPQTQGGCGSSCGGPKAPAEVKWAFWGEAARRGVFAKEFATNALFLLKWLTLAYLLEAIMVAYVPAEAIAGLVGGEGLGAIAIGATLGAPAYLNGYAAPALVAALMDQGMGAGAAMAFIVSGAITCIPAAAAVFALVKRPVFLAYLSFAFIGALISGIAFAAYWTM